ncbi:hypothetical protein CR513_18505, partial [Mucuna pruriens]
MDPMVEYLKDGKLPADSVRSNKIRKEASKRRRSICGTHIGGRVLAGKIARVGYYWPTLKADCMNYVKRCDKCQRFADSH